jgi:hypothetical protein
MGKSEAEVAIAAGLNLPSYYDVETDDDELESCLTLDEVSKLCAFLAVDPAWLYTGEKQTTPHPIDLATLSNEVRLFIASRDITVAEFEDQVGYFIAPCFED